MGDDVNDLPLLARVGLSACPADARPEVRERVHFVASAPGGRGAVRELCELILRAKGISTV
jgi:3-deoxy-D-manno-octulosonate 8-phosphate phosphatase (KDO 8-P phosphatase)